MLDPWLLIAQYLSSMLLSFSSKMVKADINMHHLQLLWTSVQTWLFPRVCLPPHWKLYLLCPFHLPHLIQLQTCLLPCSISMEPLVRPRFSERNPKSRLLSLWTPSLPQLLLLRKMYSRKQDSHSSNLRRVPH